VDGDGDGGAAAARAEAVVEMLQDQHKAFEHFMASYARRGEVQEAAVATGEELRAKHQEAKEAGSAVNQARDGIEETKRLIEQRRAQLSLQVALGGGAAADATEDTLMQRLAGHKEDYKAAYARLEQAKGAIKGIKAMQASSQQRVQADFGRWYAAMCATHGAGPREDRAAAGDSGRDSTGAPQRGPDAQRILTLTREQQLEEYKSTWMDAEVRASREAQKQALQDRYSAAKQLGEVVGRTRAAAQRIKASLEGENAVDGDEAEHAKAVMAREVRLCKDSVARLQALKQEIEHTQQELSAGNTRIERDFELWLHSLQG